MAKPPQNTAQKPEAKKGGIGSVFGAFTGALDDIVNEVKRDLRDMTPPEAAKDPATKRQQELTQRSNAMQSMLGSAANGLAENNVYGQELPLATAPLPNSQPVTTILLPEEMPTGNLWERLRDPAYAKNLRADACYHALTAADVESYARAISNEGKPPFTLGLVAINLPAFTEEDLTEQTFPEPDLLTQTLLKTLQAEPRLFGAIGAGPRQLWPNLQALDDYLTHLLNNHRKIIAIGPLGLDETFAAYTLPQQQAQLALQLEVAAAFNIPVFITARKSVERLTEVLNTSQATLGQLPLLVYLDAITTAEEAQLVKQFNMFALLRPELTQPDFTGKDFYRGLPPSQLLLASGSALVAPNGFSGHFNQPKFLENSLQAGAKIRGSQVALLAPTTSKNLLELFKL